MTFQSRRNSASKYPHPYLLWHIRSVLVVLLLLAGRQVNAQSVIISDPTSYSIPIQNGSAPCSGTCDLSPSYNQENATGAFSITKITFNWVDSGGNDCDQVGHYAARISGNGNSSGTFAISSNNIYMGCGLNYGPIVYSGELDFTGQIVPPTFYLDFDSVDGGLQGGAAINVSNVEIWGSTLASNGATQIGLPVLFVHGICDTPDSFLNEQGAVALYLHQYAPEAYPSTSQYEYVVYYDDQNKVVQFQYPNSLLPANTTNPPMPSPPTPAQFFLVALDDPGVITGYQYFDPISVAGVPIYEKGDELFNIIQEIKAITGSPRVVIVAHSMGGLDSRSYIEGLAGPNGSSNNKDVYLNDVAALITVDTPHGGSSLAMQSETNPLLTFLGPLVEPGCPSTNSVNKSEMFPSGIDTNNYDIASVIPELNYASGKALPWPPAIATTSVISEWDAGALLTLCTTSPLVPPCGLGTSFGVPGTDDVLLSNEQDLCNNMSCTTSQPSSSFSSITSSFPTTFITALPFSSDVCGINAPLHDLHCTGSAIQTASILEPAVLASSVIFSGAIQVSPSAIVVPPGASNVFFQSSAQSTAWSVVEGNGGTISARSAFGCSNPATSTGSYACYNAPSDVGPSGGVYHLLATNASNPTQLAIVSITVSPEATQIPQTINFSSLPSQVEFGEQPLTLTATASSGLLVTFSVVSGPATITNNNTLTLAGPGTVVVAASQVGNSTYAAAQATQTIVALSYPPLALVEEVGASSSTQTGTIVVPSDFTLGSISVVTEGAPNLDFNYASGGTCTVGTAYTSGQSCTVNYTFAPIAPGQRIGAILLVDSAGTTQATQYMSGVGIGPEAALTPGVITSFFDTLPPSADSALCAGLAIDAVGNVYKAQCFFVGNVWENEIIKVSPNGTVTTVAGGGASGFSGDGGAATDAALDQPGGLAVDGAGNLYIADYYNQRIRKVDKNGIITTVAGSGPAGPDGGNYSGDNGPAILARLNEPSDVTVDGAGNLYIADWMNYVIRKVDTNGIITTVNSTSAASFQPSAVAVDAAGNLYISDPNHQLVHKVNTSGIMTVVAGDGHGGYSGDGGAAISADLHFVLNLPDSIAIDAAGEIYIADAGNFRIRKVDSNGIITTVAGYGGEGYYGDNGPATGPGAGFSTPSAVALDSAGNLYIGDAGWAVRKVTISQSQLNFPTSTNVGSMDSADGSQIATVSNIGNASLTLAVPVTGNNPSVAGGFIYDQASTCPQLNMSSSSYTWAPGGNCTYAVDFTPTALGVNNGTLVLSDTSLNGINIAQTVSLSGTGVPSNVGTTTSLGSSLNPSSYGQGVVITATVAQASGTTVPTGTVQFSIDGNAVGSAVPLNAGIATYTAVNLLTGNHNMTAVYQPANQSGFSTSNASLSQAVTMGMPVITWAPPAAIRYGIPLSSTQLNASSTVTGTFAYTPAMGTVLGVGTQTLSATFTPSDSTDYNAVTTTVQLIVNQALPSLVVSTSGTPSTFGGSVTFSATISNSLSGTITFYDSEIPIGTGTTSQRRASTQFSTSSLAVGTHTITANWPGSTNFSPVTSSPITQIVNQATPTVSWAPPSPITYGTALNTTQLSATSPVAGTFAYTPAAGVVLGAGTQTLSVTFTPTDVADYTTLTTTVPLTVGQATPAIIWATPPAIAYGTALSAAQLNASSAVPGAFAYSPTSGTILGAGAHTLSASFTPTDKIDYTSATATATLIINQAKPVLNWATPAPITAGTALSTAQLDATSPVAGAFLYSPPAGTVLPAGTQTLSATFTPTDTTDYTSVTTTVQLTVNPSNLIEPKITWTTPAAITYGTALGSKQLDASSNVAGNFTYSPAAGTILSTGTQALSVTFTPTNTAKYATATATVQLTVNQDKPVIAWATPAAITYGTPLGSAELDATTPVPGDYSYSPAIGAILGAGPQTLLVMFTPSDSTDYTTATATLKLTISKATPTITWATPAPISYGTPLSSTQLDASSTVAGSFAYSSAVGTVLGVGAHTLTASFTPTDITDYTTARATVSLTVGEASQTIAFTPPSSPVVYGVSPLALSATSSSGLKVSFSVVSGPAKVSGSTLTITGAGTVVVAANQPGNSAYSAAAQVTETIVVNRAKPTVTLKSSASSFSAGKSVTFTSTVVGGSVKTTGTVTFFDGATVLGTVTLNTSGVATYATSTLSVATHSITASYGGDANCLAATSGTVPVTVK